MTTKNKKLRTFLPFIAVFSLILISIISNAEFIFDREALIKKFDKEEKFVEKRVNLEVKKVEGTKDFKLVKEHYPKTPYEDETPGEEDFVPSYGFSYIDKNKEFDNETDEIYSVSIYTFDGRLIYGYPYDENYLISWIEQQVGESKGIPEFDGHKVFIDKTNNNIFWRSGPFFIQVNGKYSDILEENKNLEKNEFPSDLILEYLKQYPSDCSENGCGRVLREEDYAFGGVSVEEMVQTLKDLNKEYICPSEFKENKIKDILTVNGFDPADFSKDNLNSIEDQCKSAKSFILRDKFNDKFMRECFGHLSNLIRENFKGDNFGIDIIEYNSDYIVEECISRKKFDIRYQEEIKNNKDKDFFDKILRDRDISFVINMRFVDPKDVEERKIREEEGRYDPSKNYTIENFPLDPTETMEEFVERFESYFNRSFDLEEWQKVQIEKRKKKFE